MSRTYLPTREGDLREWAMNFNTLIGANPTGYGLTATQATAYATAYAAFADLYDQCQQTTLRTPATVQDKNLRKAELIAITREYVNICQAYPEMDDTKRVMLRITVKDTDPSPVPVPSSAPGIEFVSVLGHTVTLRLQNTESPVRARPEYVVGATLFTYVGAEPPTDIAGWKFEGNVKKTLVQVQVPATVPGGSSVWFTAFWRNNRDESGPAAQPMRTWVGFGGVSMAA